MDRDAVDRGENDQRVGFYELRELCGREVLVDDGGNAQKLAILFNDRNAAAAHGDDDVTRIDQRIDHVLFDDVDGLRTRHDLAVAAACVLDHRVALLRGDLLRFLPGIERADRLGRMLKRRIVLIDEHLRNDGRDGLFDAARFEFVLNAVLQMVADIPLAHRAALRERHIRLDRLGVCRGGHRKVDHADLRTVAVRNHDLIARLDEVDDGLCSLGDELELFIRRVAQRVSAEGDDEFLHV